jgi:hypothetical protein
MPRRRFLSHSPAVLLGSASGVALAATVALVGNIALGASAAGDTGQSGVHTARTATPEQPPPATNCATTAAVTHGWGAPNRSNDFTDPALAGWRLYNGPGHAGNGRRTPTAASVAAGVMTITGDARGNSEGMAWAPGQTYGRWEACVRSSPAAAGYHSVLLLWPDAEDWPSGGEIDFMEITDPRRQAVGAALHYGATDEQENSTVEIDATTWHSWAVEWTHDDVTFYVDWSPWWQVANPAIIPHRAMQLCIQLDDLGGDLSQGGQLMVDWVRQYPVP